MKSVLDSISENIVVIDAEGAIQYVNAPWCNLVNGNQAGIDWKELNYLSECDKASAMGDESGTKAADGIRSVLNGRQPEFYLEYPCHSPDEKRWFMMRVTPLQWDKGDYFVLVHQDITERKLAEEKVNALARIDGLTGIANRRALDEFLHEECRRCMRLEKPVSLAMVDLDHFKLLNDTYGHQKGDDCLRQVASLLMETVNRPGDICARYGGEEFILVWGDTPLEQAWELANQFLGKLADARIPNRLSPSGEHLTASIGLAATIPASDADETGLITEADHMLYVAKQNGRNRIEPTTF
ncbi:MAG: diguanylate cyclase [Pseudomonadota bacterium]